MTDIEAEARRDERALIVAWLRQTAALDDGVPHRDARSALRARGHL